MTGFDAVAGWAAVIAAVATVVGAVLLGLFFAKGQPWGTLNDIASIVLMAATIPVALEVANLGAGSELWPIVGITGMVGAIVAQGLLVLRVRSYPELLPYTLGAGAIVGLWYLEVAFGGSEMLGADLGILAALSGAGYIALGYGFWRGNERHPLSIAGGLVLVVASTAFLGWFGIQVLNGNLAPIVPG